jgi:hypothetical protein
MTDINVLRNSMLESMIKYLTDDCYVYIMTTGYDLYEDSLSEEKNFFVFEFGLQQAFMDKFKQLYDNLAIEQLSEETYSGIVKSTVSIINGENHNFLLSLNEKAPNKYEVAFVKK